MGGYAQKPLKRWFTRLKKHFPPRAPRLRVSKLAADSFALQPAAGLTR